MSIKFYHIFWGDDTVYEASRQMSGAELAKDLECESTEIDLDLDPVNLEDLLNDGLLHLVQQGSRREPTVYSTEQPNGFELFKRLRTHVTALRGQNFTLTPLLTRRTHLSALAPDFRTLQRHVASAKALRECVETWWAGRDTEAVNVSAAHSFDTDIETAEGLITLYNSYREEAERLQLASLEQISKFHMVAYGVAA